MRRNCPFYGRAALLGRFVDQFVNQCALIVGSFSPCAMELASRPVDWNDCPVWWSRSPSVAEPMKNLVREEICAPAA